jgi:aerobic-type carbon monoxide dehydrogenase small subunit (CoxS/CutS family)
VISVIYWGGIAMKDKALAESSLAVSSAKLKGTPGLPVSEFPTRWEGQQMKICTFTLNGDPISTAVPVHWTALEMLRYKLGFTGTKQGCDKGDCGSCTVLIDGEPMLSCIVPSMEIQGACIETVENLANQNHPLLEAFEEYGAAQCGFCIPGMLISAQNYLEQCHILSRQDIAEALSGNLCRCTGYTKILDAVEAAGRKMGKRSG